MRDDSPQAIASAIATAVIVVGCMLASVVWPGLARLFLFVSVFIVSGVVVLAILDGETQ